MKQKQLDRLDLSKETIGKARKRERDRERMARKTKRRGEYRSPVFIMDFAKAEAAEDSPSWLSDEGAGVDAIVNACDHGTNYYERRLDSARRQISRVKSEWLEVLNLAIRNGNDREESIRCLALKCLRKRLNG